MSLVAINSEDQPSGFGQFHQPENVSTWMQDETIQKYLPNAEIEDDRLTFDVPTGEFDEDDEPITRRGFAMIYDTPNDFNI